MVMGQTANLTAEAGDYQWTSTVGADAEPVPELEFDQTANLTAEAGDNQWTSPVDADAEPVPELEFDQTLGW